MFQVIRRKKTKNIRQTSCKPNTVLRVSSESYFQHLQMKCLGFTFAFHCVPSLHGIGSVLNLFLLLPYLPFHFRERPIHFHFTTSILPGSEKDQAILRRQTESTRMNTSEKWVKSNTYSANFWCGYNIFELITDKQGHRADESGCPSAHRSSW